MKFSKRELLLMMYLATKIISLVTSYLDPELKNIFNDVVHKFIDVINNETRVVE